MTPVENCPPVPAGALSPPASKGSHVPSQAIFSDKLPKTAGPFSPAVRSGEFIYVSGQIGQDPMSGRLVDGGIERQTEQAFANLSAVLAASGKSLADVVRAGVYLTDMRDFATMNAIYARHFAEPYPARTTVGVAALPLGAAMEIDVVVTDSPR
jgi:2-iminobutanoate/2-iminopropanoate deaminase